MLHDTHGVVVHRSARIVHLVIWLLLTGLNSSSVLSHAQSPVSDAGDFVQDGFKFHRTTPAGIPNMPSVYMVTEISSSNSVGEIMVRPDGTRTSVGFGGFDKDKLEAAYLKHVGGNTAAVSAAGTSPSSPAPAAGADAAAPSFDAVTKTMSLPGRRSVTFTDDTHAEVRLPIASGIQTYQLEYHKGGGGRFMKSWAATEQGRTGASLSGSGVTISAAGPNGAPGGVIYDTARGAILPSEVERAKLVISAVHDASEAAKATGHPELAQEKVIKSLLANNLGLK